MRNWQKYLIGATALFLLLSVKYYGSQILVDQIHDNFTITPKMNIMGINNPVTNFEVKDTINIIRATRYHAEVSQCDSSPFKTADGSKIINSKVKSGEQRWVALSRDLIKDEYRDKLFPENHHWNGKIHFGDIIVVHSINHPHLNGDWVVHDCMNARYKRSMDFLTVRGVKPVLGIGRDIKITLK